MSLGKTIRRYREGISISQAHLATCAGLSQGYLSQIENDDVSNPSAAVIFHLAQALHVDPHGLLEAAGYQPMADNGRDEGFEAMVDLDLLAFLVRLSPEQQRQLLHLLYGLEARAESPATSPAKGRGERERVTTKVTTK
jgi:transcriptional regulator with XRE-family HTH domain